MNTSNHATTHHTPFYLLYGHEARLPSELRELYPHDGLTSTLVVELVQRLQEAYEIVRFHRQQSGEQSAQRYNTGRRVVSYEPHTMVWLFVPSVRRGQSPKLAAFWQGPYEVLEKSNDGLNYKLLDRTAAAGFRGRKLEQTVHVNRLKPLSRVQPNPRRSPPYRPMMPLMTPEISLRILRSRSSACNSTPTWQLRLSGSSKSQRNRFTFRSAKFLLRIN